MHDETACVHKITEKVKYIELNKFHKISDLKKKEFQCDQFYFVNATDVYTRPSQRVRSFGSDHQDESTLSNKNESVTVLPYLTISEMLFTNPFFALCYKTST